MDGTFGWSVLAGVVLSLSVLAPLRRRERREQVLQALARLASERAASQSLDR